MTDTEAQKILETILRQVAPEVLLSDLDKDQPLRDQIEIDSYDIYRMLTILEEKSGVRVPELALRKLRTLKDLIQYIASSQASHPEKTP